TLILAPPHGSKSNCIRDYGRITLPAIFRIELLVVAHVEDHWGRSNQCGVGQTGADCIHTTLKGAKNITTARVAADLTIVVSDDANQQTRRKFESSSPLKMKFVATLIVGSRIFDIERDTRSSIVSGDPFPPSRTSSAWPIVAAHEQASTR